MVIEIWNNNESKSEIWFLDYVRKVRANLKDFISWIFSVKKESVSKLNELKENVNSNKNSSKEIESDLEDYNKLVNNQLDNKTVLKSKEKEPSNTEIVPIKNYMKDIKYDLKYATTDNSFWVKAYSDWESNLRLQYGALKKLSKAQEILNKQWYQLKIWDAYRPTDAQKKLYDNYKWPTSTKSSNIAKPWTSHHWTWKAIDLTLVDSNGNELEMPTKFDDFSWNARWDRITWNSGRKYENALILRKAMEQAWFYTIASEWRHYQIDKWRSTLKHLN